MTTSTATLASFLLDRIAEDKAIAQEVLRDRHRLIEQGARIEDPDTRSLETWEDGPSPFAAMSAERLLAECEAKRRIIEEHQVDLYVGADEDGGDLYSCDGFDGGSGPHPSDVRCRTLVALVQPYASHAEFRDEWRA